MVGSDLPSLLRTDGRIAVVSSEHVLILQYPCSPGAETDFTCQQALPPQGRVVGAGLMKPKVGASRQLRATGGGAAS